MLHESARIVRGQITPLTGVTADELDALILPGGFGAAKNLCTFAVDGTAMKVLPDVERLVRDARGRQAAWASSASPRSSPPGSSARSTWVTIGNDPDTAAAIERWGAQHVDCAVDEIVVDPRAALVTTPAYMLDRPDRSGRRRNRQAGGRCWKWPENGGTPGAQWYPSGA